jgi:hydrogenase expression/formation protein HypC
MCLAIPGLVLWIDGGDSLTRQGRVEFGGIVRLINLAFVPEAEVGSYVLVHAGVAISIIDEQAAEYTLRALAGLEE